MKKYLFALLTGFCLATFPLMASMDYDDGDGDESSGVTLAQLFAVELNQRQTLETTNFSCATAFLKSVPISLASDSTGPTARIFTVQIANKQVNEKKNVVCHPLLYDLSSISSASDIAQCIEEQCRQQLRLPEESIPSVEDFQMKRLQAFLGSKESFSKLVPPDLAQKAFQSFSEEGAKAYQQEMSLTKSILGSESDFTIQVGFNSPSQKSVFMLLLTSKLVTDEPEIVLRMAKICPSTATEFFGQIGLWIFHAVQNEVIKIQQGGKPSLYS